MSDQNFATKNFATKNFATKNFAIEQLETRLEQFCIVIPYVGTCYKHVWFITIPYPCVKYYRLCF